MSISVSIPKEITDYKEKIIFSLSLRELICLISAIILGTASYAFCTQILDLSSEITGYLVILFSAPLLAVGFIRKDKLPFEKYVAFRMAHFFSQKQFSYATQQNYFDIQSEINERKFCNVQLSRKKTTKRPEADIFFTNQAKRNRKRKQALLNIRAAKKEFKQSRT